MPSKKNCQNICLSFWYLSCKICAALNECFQREVQQKCVLGIVTSLLWFCNFCCKSMHCNGVEKENVKNCALSISRSHWWIEFSYFSDLRITSESIKNIVSDFFNCFSKHCQHIQHCQHCQQFLASSEPSLCSTFSLVTTEQMIYSLVGLKRT